jgi:drug/metabolite transporter (DMT)-like permease
MLTLASLSWASGSLYSRSAPSPASQVQAVSMQMLAGGLVLMTVAGITGEFTALNVGAVSWHSLISLAYLALFGSTAYAVYVWLLKVSEPSKVATYAFVNPVIALALGSILAGEPFSPWTLFCSIVIITSVALIVTSRASSASKEAIIQPDRAPRAGHPAIGAASTCEPE